MYSNNQKNYNWKGNVEVNSLTKYSKDMDKLKYAEEVMKDIGNNKKDQITSNQMRIILSLFVNVRNELEKNGKEEKLKEEELYKIKYIKVKLIYQVARVNLKEFLKKTYLNEMIDDVETREDFYKLVDYVEALVAYQKFYMSK